MFDFKKILSVAAFGFVGLEISLFFLVVQMCYFIVIFNREESGRVKKIHSNIRFFASIAVAVITYFVLREGTDLLSLLSTVYYINLVWAFYVPSQTLISLGTVFEKKRKIS